MVNVGQFNKLKIVKKVPFGVYLDGGSWGEILLPNKYVPEAAQLDDEVHVFIYFDSEDKVIATTVRPRVKLGNCAFLPVVDVNAVGAFLDWGLDKDLLVPGSEQHRPMELGKSYLVYVKQDNQGRLIASSKIDHFLDKQPASYKKGDEVSLFIAENTTLGTKVVINSTHWGLIHSADLFARVSYGDKIPGYIKNIRDDGKIDVVLKKAGHEHSLDLAGRILEMLREKGGFLPLHDKSSPLDIQRAFGESKKSFKNAIGHLYKQGAIQIEAQGIRVKNSRP